MIAPVLAAARFVDLTVPWWAWCALVGGIAVLLVGDLLVVHRHPHAISVRGAAIESGVWIALGLAFAVSFAALALPTITIDRWISSVATVV